MRSTTTDTNREPAPRPAVSARPPRAPAQPEGPAKALEQAGALGNQAFQRQAQGAKDEEGAVPAAPEAAPAPPSSEDPEEVLAKLGEGKAIPSEARRRMEAAFGEDFSEVRLHDDATAAMLATDLGARAFAVGEHLAMGSGEMQPGTVVGDAILAHELAHVMQQREGDGSESAKDEAGGSVAALEDDADLAAGNATQSLWSGGSVSPVDKPRARSGLRLARCNGDTKPDISTKKTVSIGTTKLHGSTPDVPGYVDYANKKVYNQANLEVKDSPQQGLDETKTKAVLGGDLVLEEYTSSRRPTQEEKDLLKVNPVSGGIAVYFVERMSKKNRGETFSAEDGAGAVASVVANSGDETSFAHELGHALLDGKHDGHSQSDDENIMFAPAGAKKRYKLDNKQIKRVRENPLAK